MVDHAKRTQILTEEVVRWLGLGPEETCSARHAALLYDVGKIGIPDSILNKPSELTEEEWEIMRRHPKIGADIVGKIPGFGTGAEAILAHHERHDGSGYPTGLSETDIPVCACLISAIDAFDVMTRGRPYRQALAHEQAVAELEANSGGQFNPEVVEALKAVLLERGEAY
jgi:HD-GYP domain-containing protein (c-di-GMP phosphodiesterase class II)